MPTTPRMPSGRVTYRDDPNLWAEFRQIEDVPEGKRRPVITEATTMLPKIGELQTLQAALNNDGVKIDPATAAALMGGDTISAISTIADLMVVAFVRAWSWGEVTVEVLMNEVPGDVYGQLRDLCLPMFPEIAPKFDAADAVTGTGPNGEPILDRGGPTPPSAG